LGEGVGFPIPQTPFVFGPLDNFDPTINPAFNLTGLSGEDSNDLVISWASTANGGDIMARHIRVTFDPTGTFIADMSPEGAAVTVNSDTAGVQDQFATAGVLGDRWMTVYHDNNAAGGINDDIVLRIMDTRDAVNPDPLIGDLVRNGTIQARVDILIGTTGDDYIQGDILDNNGLVDSIYGGLGNDTLRGGPGLRGPANSTEIIDGGEGDHDMAVYTGKITDY